MKVFNSLGLLIRGVFSHSLGLISSGAQAILKKEKGTRHPKTGAEKTRTTISTGSQTKLKKEKGTRHSKTEAEGLR